MKAIGFLLMVLVAAITAGCGGHNNSTRAAGTDAAATGTSGKAGDDVSWGDKDFVHDAAIAGMAEVELGRLATARAANAEVKKFGQMMIDDHTAAGEKLKGMAMHHHIELPAQLDDKRRDLRDRLAKKQGTDFDREYVLEMVYGHQELVDKLEFRIDRKSLADWKAGMADRLTGKKVLRRGQAFAVLPDKSDNPVVRDINQWAADAFPVASAHLEAAKALDRALKNRDTTP
jgi:putative membrane protein